MLTHALAILLFAQPAINTVRRDSYGVPDVIASDEKNLFRLQGFAVAEDRLWQMELSRRIARGKMAEVMGASGLSSDKEYARLGYTDSELAAMLSRQSKSCISAFESFAAGVNEYISRAKAANSLPSGYAENGFTPSPWTIQDSVAICVQMARLFGGGGAGELRNYALYLYLLGQPCKDRVLDVIDDLAWLQDPKSIPTVDPADDPLAKSHLEMPIPTRAQTQAQIAALPKASALELLPAIRLASNDETKAIAMKSNTIHKVGSYAIVVGKNRSATGYPLLLSGPQMGHSSPSVVHQIRLDCPTYRAEGLSVPGIPGVLVGATPKAAWALTSGVADNTDIFYFPSDGKTFEFEGKKEDFETESFKIAVKGGDTQTVVQKRTQWGPVILESAGGKCVYVQRSTLALHELDGFDAIMHLVRDFDVHAIDQFATVAPPSFNLFYATKSGEIGYQYCGWVPNRKAGIDPRFPVMASKQSDWNGIISAEKMPHVRNPQSGLLVNWNNKPAIWWANSDTPVWGELFRNQTLLDQLSKQRLAEHDLERAIWAAARLDEVTLSAFLPFAKTDVEAKTLGYGELCAFDGWKLDGSISAGVYSAFVDALREEVFYPSTGNFLSAANARQILQATPMLRALRGETIYDYLRGRSRAEVVRNAFGKAMAKLGPDPTNWRYKAGGIRVPDQAPIPYSNRGTYIQILELRADGILGRNVASPGVSESGPHAFDQVPLARSWMYRNMTLFRD